MRAQLARDQLAVADHGARDRGERPWYVQTLEPLQDLARVGSRDEDSRGGDSQRALDQDVPRTPQARHRQRSSRALSCPGPRRRRAGAAANATNGSSIAEPPSENRSGIRATHDHRDQDGGVRCERPERLAGVATTANTNADRGDELAFGRERWTGESARDESRTVETGAHRSGRFHRRRAERRPTTNQRPPKSAPASAKVIATPTMPEIPCSPSRSRRLSTA